MQIDLSEDVFQDTSSLLDLIALFRCFADGPHVWSAQPHRLQIAEQYLQNNVPALTATLIELGRKGLVATAWSSSKPRPVVVCKADLKDYVADLSQSAVLVVENQVSDGSFVRALAIVFGAHNIITALSRHWLIIEHGGGSGLGHVAAIAAERFRRRIRVVAVLDSDRMTPTAQTQCHLKAGHLRQAGVAAHVLELREAENYVPNKILRRVRPFKETSQRLNHLKKLTNQQRGHFDMKRGFGPVTGPPRIPPEQLGLFNNLDGDTILGLRGGFGDGLLQELEAAASHLDEHDFRSLGNSVVAEIRALLETIDTLI